MYALYGTMSCRCIICLNIAYCHIVNIVATLAQCLCYSKQAHTVQMKHRNHFGWCISSLHVSLTLFYSASHSVCIMLSILWYMFELYTIQSLAFHQNTNAALFHSWLAMLNVVVCSIIILVKCYSLAFSRFLSHSLSLSFAFFLLFSSSKQQTTIYVL